MAARRRKVNHWAAAPPIDATITRTDTGFMVYRDGDYMGTTPTRTAAEKLVPEAKWLS